MPKTNAPTSKPIALPNPFLYQPAAIFIPIGYIPVKKNPVRNLNTSSEYKSLAMKRINRFDIAPRIDEYKNIFRGEYLSENAKNAKTNVPEINPSCTADVTLPTSLRSTFIADCKSVMIAFPANHNEVHVNWENMITGRICLGTFINN